MINREDKIIVEEQQGSATMVEPKNIGENLRMEKNSIWKVIAVK